MPCVGLLGLLYVFTLKDSSMKKQEQIAWGWAGKQWLPQQYINYRIQQPHYEQLWAEQQGRCPGCRGELAHPLRKEQRTGLKPETDHLHVEGRHCEKEDVRGIMCHNCNALLGKIRDNMNILAGLLIYLKKHGDLHE